VHPANDFASPPVLEANAKILTGCFFSESLPCNSETLASNTHKVTSHLLPFVADDISLSIMSEFFCVLCCVLLHSRIFATKNAVVKTPHFFHRIFLVVLKITVMKRLFY